MAETKTKTLNTAKDFFALTPIGIMRSRNLGVAKDIIEGVKQMSTDSKKVQYVVTSVKAVAGKSKAKIAQSAFDQIESEGKLHDFFETVQPESITVLL